MRLAHDAFVSNVHHCMSRRAIELVRHPAWFALMIAMFTGAAHAHRLEGTQTTLVIEGQMVALSLHTSPDALAALYGRRSASESELHQLFLEALSLRSANLECVPEKAIRFDAASLTAVRELLCESVNEIELTTVLPITPGSLALHVVRVVIDGRMTVSQMPPRGATLRIPVADLRARWVHEQ